MLDDLLHYRRLRGDGSFDITSVVAIFQRRAAWKPVGPEAFADAMDILKASEAGANVVQTLTGGTRVKLQTCSLKRTSAQ